MSSNALAQQCYDEGFNRQLDALVKQAVTPRMPTIPPIMGGGRAGEMALRGKMLELAVKNPATGSFGGLVKRWQAPYGMLAHLDTHKSDFIQTMQKMKQIHREAVTAGDHAGAATAVDKMKNLRSLYDGRRQQLYGQLGTGAEPRRKLVEVGLPIAAGGAAIGGAAGVGAHIYGKEQARRDTLGDMGDATFTDRLKYLLVPKRTMAQRLFNS